jgi:hypothetical protein
VAVNDEVIREKGFLGSVVAEVVVGGADRAVGGDIDGGGERLLVAGRPVGRRLYSEST